MLIYWQFVIDFELSEPALTSEPAGVDVVRPVVLVAGAEEHPVAVCGQEVR